MIGWLRKFKWKTVAVVPITVNWTDTGGRSTASIIFRENGFGKRKLIKEGSLYPRKIESHPYWNEVAIPWKYGKLQPNAQEETTSTQTDTTDNNVIKFTPKPK